MQTPGPEFVDDYGIRWIWDATSKSYQMATHMDKNTLDQATGGDVENGFATDQSWDGKWEKTDNPLQEGIMSSVPKSAEYTNTVQMPEPEDATEDVSGLVEHHAPDCPCEKCKFKREIEDTPQVHQQWAPFFEREPHRNRMKYDDSFPSMISTGAALEEEEDPFGEFELSPDRHVGWFQDPDTGVYHFSAPGMGHAGIPRYRELMENPKENIPRIKNVGNVINGDIHHLTDNADPRIEPEVAQQYEQHRQSYPLLPPINNRSLIPDPNPMPQDMLRWRDYVNPKTYVGNTMTDMPADRRGPHYFQRLAWEEAQPSLDSCPSCSDPMVSKGDSSYCHSCGHTQPVIYAKNKTAGLGDALTGIGGAAALALPWLAGPEVGAPVDAAILGEEGAAGAGAAAGGGGLGDLMNGAMGKGKQYLQFEGLHDLTHGGQQGGGGQPAQQGGGASYDPMSIGTVSKTASDFEENGSSATKNDGQDVDPSINSTDGYTNRDGDDPSHMKDHDIGNGDGLQALQQTFQEIMEHVLNFANSEESGESDPVLQALDQLLEAKQPGYRGQPNDSSMVVIEAEPDAEDGDWAVGEDSGEEHSPPAKEARTAAGYENAQVGALIDAFLSNQIDEGNLLAGLERIKAQVQNGGAPQAGPPGLNGYEEQTSNPAAGLGGLVAHTANLPMAPQQPGGSVPVMQQQQSMGDGTGMGGPCEVCGGAHDTAMHGVASPGQNTNALHAVAMTHEARRPKLCPYHSDIVDYSLELGDAALALQSVTPQNYGNRWCKADQFSGTCNFKPAMVKQEYWDNRQMELEQARLERQQETVFQQQEEAIPPVEETPDASMDSVDQGGWDPAPGTDTAVGGPVEMVARTGSSNWVDGSGQPLIPGQVYLMKSPQYAVPDKVTIDNVDSPNKLKVTVHSEMMDYTDELTHQDLDINGFQFMPDPNPAQTETTFTPEQNNDYPFYDDPGGTDDLSDLPTPVSHSESEPDRSGLGYLLEDNGSQFDGVDPMTLAKLGMGHVAGKDFSHQEQMAFVNEAGQARNMDSLDLAGTHYQPIDEYRNLDDEIFLGF